MLQETPNDSPLASGMNTPLLEPDTRHHSIGLPVSGKESQTRKRSETARIISNVDYDSDIDPDDLLPVYLDCKAKLFRLQSATTRNTPVQSNGRISAVQKVQNRQPTVDPESAKILRKIKRIEDDILFDKYLADQQWNVRRIKLERDAAACRNIAKTTIDSTGSQTFEPSPDSEDEVSREAAAIGNAMLEEVESDDDDAAIADLFASLPVNEVDPLTGKSSTVINGVNGVKITIRDFGKWTGVSPVRVLEEACRARSVVLSL